jgi:predicted amino acid-binding ACT domain protein
MPARSYVTIGLVGPDRTGAIAAVTQQLFRMGANIESLEEQVARGKFRMTLLASWPGSKLDQRRISTELESLARHLRMKLTLRLADSSRTRRRLAILSRKKPMPPNPSFAHGNLAASTPSLFSSLEIIPNFAPSRAAFAFLLPRSITATAKKPKPPSNLISRKPKWISSYSPAS